MAVPIITGLARSVYEARVPKRLYTAYERLEDTLDNIDDVKANYAIAEQRASTTNSAVDWERAHSLQMRLVRLQQKQKELETKIKSYKTGGRIPGWRQNPKRDWQIPVLFGLGSLLVITGIQCYVDSRRA